MPLHIIRADITTVDVDAIVNSADPEPIVGAGVDGMIHAAAGPLLLEARQKIGVIKIGEAFLTPGFNLPARHVIHTVGPVWQDGRHDEANLLGRCYLACLKQAVDHACQSVAFPLISAGVYRFPKDQALAIAVKSIRDFIKKHDITVSLVVYDQASFALSKTWTDAVRQYIDDHYVDTHDEARYGTLKNRSIISRKETQRIVLSNMIKPDPVRSLDDLESELEENFAETVLRLIRTGDKNEIDIYKKANLDRKLFSKIRNTSTYQPSKSTAIALAIALELNLDETKDLIARAGYALSPSRLSDVIISWAIEEGHHDIDLVNQLLFQYECKGLGTLD
ncbi:MAG: RNase III inhibitor [Acholeplasmataceae bacterium]|nr:MAG: RNase III inhibitor [Acholeplasmataceae bacterium]